MNHGITESMGQITMAKIHIYNMCSPYLKEVLRQNKSIIEIKSFDYIIISIPRGDNTHIYLFFFYNVSKVHNTLPLIVSSKDFVDSSYYQIS